MNVSWMDFDPRAAKGGPLVALEPRRDVPFSIARVYYVIGQNPRAIYGRHAHRRGEQVLVCVQGWCRARLDDGHTTQEFILDRPDRGLHLGPLLWEEFELAPGAILLVLCDTPYDPSDQIDDRDEFLALVSPSTARATAPIPFLDLKRVNDRFAAELAAAMARVTDRGLFIAGPEVQRFETAFAAYVGTRHCVAVGNGYDALRLMLRASGLRPGDEVLVPANTFIASILAVLDAGLRPVLVEPDPTTYLLDPATAARAITPRTRALLSVHLYGCCANIEALRKLSQEHRLLLFEDAAQAHGASVRGIKAGAWGTAGAFSFYPTKNLGALGDAGAVTTDDERLAADLRALRDYGGERKNEHRLLGANSRLDELQAAVLGVKLAHLDHDNQRRSDTAHRYLESIRHPEVILPKAPAEKAAHVWHLFVVRCARREALREHLAARGIGTAIHYPTPPHRQPALVSFGALSLPVTEQLHREVLTLPLHPALTDEEVDRIVEAVNSFAS